jgi:hypothetical protein
LKRLVLALTLPLLVFASAMAASTFVAQTAARSWLDSALTNWNRSGATIPKPPAFDETTASIIKRCKLEPPRSTAAERAVEAAGWIPYWNFDQKLVRDDIEIVGGMRGADGMCRPGPYNLFVFVGGKFAGSLGPAPMISRTDGASGAVRIQPPNITVEFSRYTAKDPLCCPSSHVTGRYRIDRPAAGPIVAPVEIRARN